MSRKSTRKQPDPAERELRLTGAQRHHPTAAVSADSGSDDGLIDGETFRAQDTLPAQDTLLSRHDPLEVKQSHSVHLTGLNVYNAGPC